MASDLAVLFDFDGVLVDTEPAHFRCWAEVMVPFGVRLDWDTYRERIRGLGMRQLLDALAVLADPPVPTSAMEQAYDRKIALFDREVLHAEPAVTTLLGDLAGYRLAVVSSARRAYVEPALERLGWRRHFAAVVCREDVAHLKPDPEPYRLAAQWLGASEALVVEDSDAGVASGRAAGFETLQVQSPQHMARLVRARLGLAGSTIPS